VAIERLDRALRVASVVILHETEAACLPRHAVGNDGRGADGPEGFESLSQIGFCERIVEVANK
jgi:hypothetical protein